MSTPHQPATPRTHDRPAARPRPMAALLVVVLAAAALAGCASDGADGSAGTGDDGATARLLEPAAYDRFLDANPDVPVINVHVPYEGHVAGTDAFVPFDDIGTWDGLPADLDAPIAIYCMSGNMSADATATLHDLGYTDVVDLAGGMEAWRTAGRELVDNPAEADRLAG